MDGCLPKPRLRLERFNARGTWIFRPLVPMPFPPLLPSGTGDGLMLRSVPSVLLLCRGCGLTVRDFPLPLPSDGWYGRYVVEFLFPARFARSRSPVSIDDGPGDLFAFLLELFLAFLLVLSLLPSSLLPPEMLVVIVCTGGHTPYRGVVGRREGRGEVGFGLPLVWG